MKKRMVVYDFMNIPEGVEPVDGSDEMLPPEERVTDADRASPHYGAVRDAQKALGLWPMPRPPGWGMRGIEED